MAFACLRLCILACLLPVPGLALADTPATVDASSPSTLVIGVLSPRPKEQTLAALQPTADYLSSHVQGHRFEILPLNLDEVEPAVAGGKVDFILTHPESYIVLEAHHRVTRIATMIGGTASQPAKEFGGVIFVRADRQGLLSLADLKGRTIGAVAPKAFGGYLTQAGELANAGLDLNKDVTFRFMGLPQDNIVKAVEAGDVDAGVARSGVLEAMAREGKIDLAKFRILNQRYEPGFPHLLSTPLYAEWPFAARAETPEALATQVAIALLSMPHGGEVTRRGNYQGWAIPLSYQNVHDLMKTLRAPPYDAPQDIHLRDILRQYDVVIFTTLSLALLLFLTATLRHLQLNKRLSSNVRLAAERSSELEAEVAMRQRSERRLGEENSILELVARGEALPNILLEITRICEAEYPGSPVAILSYDVIEKRLWLLAEVNLGEDCHVHLAQDGLPTADGSLDEAALRGLMGDCAPPHLIDVSIRSTEGHLLGHLAAFIHRDDEKKTTRSFLATLASLAGVAMQHRQTAERLRLNASVFSSAVEGILVANADGIIIDVNNAFCRLCGYSRDELIGRNPRLLKSGRHDANFYRTMWQGVKNNGYWRGEVWNRHKDGSLYPEILHLSTVLDSEGEISHYVATCSDISDLKQTQERLERLASYDILTGLPNRTLLTDRLRQAIAQARRRSTLLAVCFLDLDGFKPINDSFGHEAGDKLLHEVAQRLLACVRDSDTVARLGGDEFVILLGDITTLPELTPSLTRILSQLAAPYRVAEQSAQMSASIGVTLYPRDDADPDTLLRHADQAMYQAKQEGRNRFHLFDPSEDAQVQLSLHQRQRLLQALESGEFRLHYQPKINLRRGEITGVEALIRWQHPDRGLLAPAEFLPAAEHHDIIRDIGHWVLQESLRQQRVWAQAGLRLAMSVNIAAHHFLDRDFVSSLTAILEEHRAALPDSPPLELEILESAALEDIEGMVGVIHRCQELGVRFALDDFGTGYSSLTYLKRLPCDTLKIDRSFIQTMTKDKEGLAIVEGIIGLAGAFQCDLVAEGIESEEHGTLLLRMGCELGQGYAIARAMPGNEMPAWVSAYHPPDSWRSWAYVRWNVRDFPLLLAEFEHRQWVGYLMDAVEKQSAVHSPEEIRGEHLCQFGRWLQTQGKDRYGHAAQFSNIAKTHTDLHHIGAEILGCLETHQRERAKELLPQLHSASERLLQDLMEMHRVGNLSP